MKALLSSSYRRILLFGSLFTILILPNTTLISFQADSTNINSNVPLRTSTNLTNIQQSIPIKTNSANNTDLNVNNLNLSNKMSSQQSSYLMGQNQTFWVEDLGKASDGVDNNGNGKNFSQGDWSEAMYQVDAVVVNITQNAYIFVDKLIANSYTGGLGAQIGQVFETRIQSSDIQLGTPSDIDNNGKIIILIFDFREGNNHPGYYTTGYFWPLNMHKPSTDPSSIYYYSAYKEIINVNDIAIRGSGKTVDDWAPTIAHEYFHLIHYKYNPDESVWLEEGLAVFAENFAGYTHGYESYLQDSAQNGFFLHAYDHSLTYFTQSLNNDGLGLTSYGHSFLLVQYLYQRFGLGLIKNIIQTNVSGINAIKIAITQQNSSLTFDQVYSDWMITNLVNDQNSSVYSYRNFSYKISESQYNVNNELKIVPYEFSFQKIPFWSNEFFTLPQSNLNSYLLTFSPQLLSKNSMYQLSIVTFYANSSWSFDKIPLVNNQSGSYPVQYLHSNDKKVLIVSSLVGNSSEKNSVYQTDLYNLYSSMYNLFVEPYTYRPVFKNVNDSLTSTSYYFNIYSSANQLVPKTDIPIITIQVYKWGDTSNNQVLSKPLSFDTVNQYWIINHTIFDDLTNGQYYFTLGVQTTNISIVPGLTFLIDSHQNQNNDIMITVIVGSGIVVAVPSVWYVKKRRK